VIVMRPQTAIARFQMTLARDPPASARRRVDHPHVWHAHLQIVIEAVLKPGECVFRRQNFNADVGRLREHLLIRFGKVDDADIRHTATLAVDLHSLFGKGINAERTPQTSG